MLLSMRARKGIQKKLGEALLSDGLIGDDQLRRALEKQHLAGGFLGEIMVSLGFVTPSQIKPYLERVTGFVFVDLSELDLDPELSSRITESYAASKMVLPF